MHSGPSKTAEAIVAVFVPPACREEVLGDLHERYTSSRQYGIDAVHTIPLVIISRIRRTTDPQVLLMQGFALYSSFLTAASLKDRALLSTQWGLLRLAIPAGMATLGLILEDAYAKSGKRWSLELSRGPAVGLGLALASQGVFQISNPDLALPSWITFYGCALGLLFSSGIRILFPPSADQLQGANIPAAWLKQSTKSIGKLVAGIRAVRNVAAIIAAMAVGTWIAQRAALPRAPIVLLSALVIAYQVWKRG